MKRKKKQKIERIEHYPFIKDGDGKRNPIPTDPMPSAEEFPPSNPPRK